MEEQQVGYPQAQAVMQDSRGLLAEATDPTKII